MKRAWFRREVNLKLFTDERRSDVEEQEKEKERKHRRAEEEEEEEVELGGEEYEGET